MPGDEVAAWSGWRMFLTGIALVIGSIVGSFATAVALDGFSYNVACAAVVFESGLAAAHIFCGSNLGRGYYPFHPVVKELYPRLLLLHAAVVALILGGGVVLMGIEPKLGGWWVTESGPKHDSPLEFVGSVLVVGVYISETAIARRWLQRAVSK